MKPRVIIISVPSATLKVAIMLAISYHGHGFEIPTAVNLYFLPMQFVVLPTEDPARN